MMSNRQAILERLRDAIIELDIDAIPGICEEAMEAGISAYDAVIEGMAKGMEIVGERYEEGVYYLAELVMAGETMKEGMAGYIWCRPLSKSMASAMPKPIQNSRSRKMLRRSLVISSGNCTIG